MLQLVSSAKMFVIPLFASKLPKKSSNIFFGITFPSLSPVVTPPAVLHAALRSQHKKDIDLLKLVWRRAIRGMKHLSYQKKLKELGLFRLAKRWLRGDLIVASQYLNRKMERDFLQKYAVKRQGWRQISPERE